MSLRISAKDKETANSILSYASRHSLFNELRENEFRFADPILEVTVDWNALLFADIDLNGDTKLGENYPVWVKIWNYKTIFSGNSKMLFVRKIISETQLFDSINLIYEAELSKKIAFYSSVLELANNREIIRVTDLNYSEELKPQQATACFEQMWRAGYLMKLRRGQYRKPPQRNWKEKRPRNWRRITTFSIGRYVDQYGGQALSDWDALLSYWRKRFWEAKYEDSMGVVAEEVKEQEYPEPLLDKLRGIYVKVRE